jgi:thiol-disulfide isomerase/thioredoxin
MGEACTFFTFFVGHIIDNCLPLWVVHNCKLFKYMMKNLFVSFIVCLLAGFGVAQAQLPAVTLKSIDGSTVQSETLSNDGKPFIIDFFATWCKPCNRELSAIAEVYDEWREDTGVKIYAVSIDQAQNINKVKPLVDQNEWEYEVLLDPNSELLKALGGQMIPFVVVVDGNGKIVSKHSGYTDGAEDELIEEVRKLLTE